MTLVLCESKNIIERLLFTRQLRVVLIVKFTEINVTEENRLYYFLT